MECWKRTKTVQPMLTWLEMEHRVEYENATKGNLFMLREAFLNKWGQWTAEKGRANFIAALTLPQIVHVKSADNIFIRIEDLRLERNAWGTELYDDTYYRQWLMEHIKMWLRMVPVLQRLESDPTCTFAQSKAAVMVLVEINRSKQILRASTNDYMKALTTSMGLQVPTTAGFTMTDNAVVMSYDEYVAAQATSSAKMDWLKETRKIPQRNIGPVESVCA